MKRCVFASVLTAALLTSTMGAAQVPPVNHVTAIARPSQYDGRCPASIEFIGTIFMNDQATVSYRWERSDGATGPVQTVHVANPRQVAVVRWQLSRPVGEVFQGAETLHVLSPGDFHSNPAQFTLVCRT